MNGNLPLEAENIPVGSAVLEDCATLVGMTLTVELRDKAPDFVNVKGPLEAEKNPWERVRKIELHQSRLGER